MNFSAIPNPKPAPTDALIVRGTLYRPEAIAAILSGAMMLDFLGEKDAAQKITKACHEINDEITGTIAIGDAVSQNL